MKQLIQVLHLEDDPADAELVQAELDSSSLTCQVTCAQDRDEFSQALRRCEYDVILADYRLPMYDGVSALWLAQEHCPDVPFIFVSGTMGEDAAIEGLTAGATDYVLKQKLSRLVPAITRALHEAENRRERKRAEEALRQRTRDMERLTTAIEQSAETVVITDTEGDIVYVNPAFEHVTGYGRAEVLGRNPRILKSNHQDLAFYQELWATICAGQVWSGNFVNRKKDGTLYTEEATISPVKGEDGVIINYVAVKRDVTRERELEEQYYQAQKMQAIGQLTAGIAHDFNNLLTAINGFAELAQYELAADHPLQDSLGQILDAGQRATKLISQLMAFSRRQMVEPRVLNLNAVVVEMDKILQRIIGEHIILKTILASDLGLAKVDPVQLEQIIVNLAVNARDAMPRGGHLTIETANATLDQDYAAKHLEVVPGEYVLLAVSDSGIGMSKEIKSRIFEPFFTTKEMGEGTGLGLATVFGIVKQSGGHITVYSELGVGTTFKIYLPVADTAATSLPAPQARRATHYGTETILLVEDDELVRRLAQRTLQAKGYTILEACSGDEALSLAGQHQGKIDLLLTDVVMPHMSGRELAEKLRTLYPQVKVLFMSGYTDDTMVRYGIQTAKIEFLNKPFLLNALTSKVREVLDK
ncbi:MAG: response regulator [Anaerolineae bacterium]|nr:response regulator [Anaerolineae bacterium]